MVCQFPTYGQLYLLPKHHGVDVDLWTMKADDEWSPDITMLRRMIKPNTTAIIIKSVNMPRVLRTTIYTNTIKQS